MGLFTRKTTKLGGGTKLTETHNRKTGKISRTRSIVSGGVRTTTNRVTGKTRKTKV